MKIAERDYYSNKLLSVKSNLRKTWDIIKGIINKKRAHTPIVKLQINGKESTDKKEISNQFVEFFTNVGKSLDDKIPNPIKTHLITLNTEIMYPSILTLVMNLK